FLSGSENLLGLSAFLGSQFLDLLIELIDLAAVLGLDLVDCGHLVLTQSKVFPLLIELAARLGLVGLLLLGLLVLGLDRQAIQQHAASEEGGHETERERKARHRRPPIRGAKRTQGSCPAWTISIKRGFARSKKKSSSSVR